MMRPPNLFSRRLCVRLQTLFNHTVLADLFALPFPHHFDLGTELTENQCQSVYLCLCVYVSLSVCLILYVCLPDAHEPLFSASS